MATAITIKGTALKIVPDSGFVTLVKPKVIREARSANPPHDDQVLIISDNGEEFWLDISDGITIDGVAFSGTQEELVDELSVVFLDAGIATTSDSPNKISGIWSGSQAEYDAIENPSDNTLYFIQ